MYVRLSTIDQGTKSDEIACYACHGLHSQQFFKHSYLTCHSELAVADDEAWTSKLGTCLRQGNLRMCCVLEEKYPNYLNPGMLVYTESVENVTGIFSTSSDTTGALERAPFG